MKYATCGLMILLTFTMACHGPDKQEPQSDSVQAPRTEISTGGNLVKSEAPDADAKTARGYALPGYGDGLAQSPVNILSDSALKDSSAFISIKFNTEIS